MEHEAIRSIQNIIHKFNEDFREYFCLIPQTNNMQNNILA